MEIADSERQLINTFSYHYRRKYRRRIGKIPLDLGLVCPNRALGGCIYCRPAAFTPNWLCPQDSLAEQLARGRRRMVAGRFGGYLAYFQQETSTALPTAELIEVCHQVVQQEECLGLILSTRPDCVADDLLDQLAGLVQSVGKECLIELGLQSMHEPSLRFLNRNHTLDDYLETVARIHRVGSIGIGTHLIFGIPGETINHMLETVRLVVDSGVHALKLHHLQVVEGTELHALYEKGEISLFTQESYLDLLLTILPEIPWPVPIHRLWTTTHPALLVAPRWNVLAAQLSRQLQETMVKRSIRQGDNFPSIS